MILITGAAGFVGLHALDHVTQHSPETEVWACTRLKNEALVRQYPHVKWVEVDMLDAPALNTLIADARPQSIIHLASASSVGYSWEHPRESTINNLNIYLNLLEAVRAGSPQTRILSVGSSEVYGKVESSSLPLTEKHPTNPASPYAVARASQESLSKIYVDGYGLDIILTRSFNHFGPRQDGRFAIPSFAKQITDAKKKGETLTQLTTGNINVIRDFTDVRDVVSAYFMILNRGTTGEIYNICSGVGRSLHEIIQMMAEHAHITLELVTDPQRVRPTELPVIIGSNAKIQQNLGWKPLIPFSQTITDLIQEWLT